ncbi:MAG: DUF3810 domain-containing protein [Acidobacteriota bacterium]|nr:DUF3810 domain-containing protein [Acidobacteriota bacterium]
MRRTKVKKVKRSPGKLRRLLWVLALAAALVPLPQAFVERVYWRTFYLKIQPGLTSLSNLLPVALLDIAILLLLGVMGTVFIRGKRRGGWATALTSTLGWLLTTTAVIYLLFLVTWGFNYRRVPMEAKLDFDLSRVSREAAVRLAGEATARLNAGYAPAHAQPLRAEALVSAFVDAQWIVGRTFTLTTGTPKKSLFGFYFRKAAVDGMTVPVFLEIILNPDLLPVERPSVLVHEWAHLAGYADESEANFIAFITGVRSGDPVAQYSAWLDVYRLSVNALPRQVRASLPRLADGPRADLAAIAARYERTSPVVRTAARGVYDSYLRANRIDEGIANYDAVLKLMLGTTFDAEWRPGLR